MPFELAWGRSGPMVKRANTCEACGGAFACEISVTGCWCSAVNLSDEARAELRANYKNCLCPSCLRQRSYTAPAAR